MKQNRRSIGSRTGDGNPVSPPDCSFRNMTAPPSNRRVSYAQRSFHPSVPCLRGLIWAAPAPANAADKIVIRFAHSNTPSDMDPYHALVTKMSDKLVKKLGADRIEIQEFPAGQIGSEERSFQDVQQGILQMTVLAVNNASIFSPSLGAFDLPYIFKSVKEFDDCVDQNWDLINKRMEAESGTVAIAWHSQGFRFITNSKQPISTLAELAPVKIRTPNNPIMIGVYRAWGTDPVPMAMDETFNALQQKVVDGQDNPLVSIATNRFYEVQKYITEPHYKLWTGPVVVNVDWLRSLPADVQQAIIEAGRETTVEMRALLDKQESASREFLKEKGMVFCGVPTDEDEWMKRAVSIWPQFYPQIKNLEIVEAFMKTLGRQLPR